MIGILSERLTTNFLNKLGMGYVYLEDTNQEIDGLFIDWVPKLPDSEGAWIKQASLLHHYIRKNIPIVIFDRYFFLNEKETNWVKKFGVMLFEPILNGRYGFEYLPEWIDSFDIDENENREYDLIYPDIEYNIPEFEKWIAEYSTFFPKKVAYSAASLSDFKKEEYKKKDLIEIYGGYEEGKTTLIIDSTAAYNRGHLSSKYFQAMNKGCLPLLPIQHKYFHSLFKGLIVEDITELDLYVSRFAKYKNVLIEDVFEKIKTEWCEFTIDHATDVIRTCFT